MPNWLSKERFDIIGQFRCQKSFKLVRKKVVFWVVLLLSEKMAEMDENISLASAVFKNQFNAMAHQVTTGPEIWFQLESIDKKPDAFVAGVGTGGTVMGVGNFLKDKDGNIEGAST
jgi:cysteine synthase A